MSGNGADLADVSNEERGKRIQERFEALDMADREWYRQTGIDRKTLNKAIAAAEGVRDSTYDAIEVALGRLEKRKAGFASGASEVEGGYVEFVVEGNFGVRATVKGPVANIAELREAAAQMVRDIKDDDSAKS